MGRSPRLEPVRLAVVPLLRCQTDERLVELARAGHERAFEAIVERYRRPLLQYCGRLLPPSRAEDVVQQAFMGAYRAIRGGEGELQLRPWLYRAAHNAAIDALRQNGWDNEPIDECCNGLERSDDAFEGRQELRDLIASLSALPRRQRDAIVLRELEGCGHEEIAVKLGLSEGAARQLIHRARAALRAGASALAPSGLLEQLLTVLRTDPVPARIPELVAGGGSAFALAKVGAAGAVAGAIAIGGAHAPTPRADQGRDRLSAPQAAHSNAQSSAEAAPGAEPAMVFASSPVERRYSPVEQRAGERGSGEQRPDRAGRGRRDDGSPGRDESDGDPSEPVIEVVVPDDEDDEDGSRDRPDARELDDDEDETEAGGHDGEERHGKGQSRAEQDDKDEDDLAEWHDDEHEADDSEDDEDD
jgi:RNA polymerase sigma factor (sigma-70 family)